MPSDMPSTQRPRPSRSVAFLSLCLPGVLALPIGTAMALDWETPLLMLFLVGAAYPALAMAAVVTLMALYEAGRNRALGVRQVLPAAIAAVWIAMFAAMLFVADNPKTPVFAAASIVAGALICGFVVAGHLGNGVAVALLGSFVLPVLLHGSVSSANSTRQAELRLGMLEKRLDEVTGTLEWETQGPSLMAERRAVERARSARSTSVAGRP